MIFFFNAKNLKLKLFFSLKCQQFFNLISKSFLGGSEFYFIFILTVFIQFDKSLKIHNDIYFIYNFLFIINILFNFMNHVSFHISHEIQNNIYVYYFYDLIMLKKIL